MKTNPCLAAASAELDKAGVPYKVDFTATHVHIHYGHEYEHLHVVAATPSDWRAPMNERSAIRRELRGYGYIGEELEIVPSAVSVDLVDGRPTCTSLVLASRFGKEHKNVLRDIDRIRSECGPEFDRLNFEPIDYQDGKSRTQRAYRMSRDGYSMVAMGFTGAKATAWKVQFLEAFNAMEAELTRLVSPAVDFMPIRAEMDALVSLIGDLETRIPKPKKSPYWLLTPRLEKRHAERRIRR